MNIKSISNTVSFYLPKDCRSALSYVKSYLLHEYGGYTETEAKGAWHGSRGVSNDELIILTSSTDQRINIEKILEIAFRFTTQEAFYFTVNGEAFIAERTFAEEPPI